MTWNIKCDIEFDDICDSSSKTKLEYIKDFLCRFNDGY